MSVTLAFDVYGTLIDTQGVVQALEQHVGTRAAEFSRSWREKQLEYSFRRGMMRDYENFTVCTGNALDYICMLFKCELTANQKQELLNTYSVLPAFSDVQAGLAQLKQSGFALYAFSNGTAQAVELLLSNAGIRENFIDIVSVDEVKSYKPDPGVYRHFLLRTDSVAMDTWLISSNPFDVLGAMAVGMRAAWVQRSPELLFDPWGIQPTVTVCSLENLAQQINSVLPRQ